MSGSSQRDNKTFETKVANLIAATRHLEIAQILLLRRLTLADPETRRWATEKQLNVVFTVIIAKAIERVGVEVLKEARARNYDGLLPKGTPQTREEDTTILAEVAAQMLGPAQQTEAEITQAGFERLLSLGANLVPPRTARPQVQVREPPPLFAAQLGPDSGLLPPAKLRAAATEDGETGDSGEPVDFTALFDDTICNYARKILTLFRASGDKAGTRMPFAVAPEFCACYEDVLRRFVLPQMRASRHIQTLAQNYNWAEIGGAKLIEIIQGSELNNPVLHNWDARWAAFRIPKAAGKPKKARPEDNPWPVFNQDATRSGYAPPTEEHLQILQDIIRYEADSLAKAWRELVQLYEQEFAPNARQEQARDGAFRDGLLKWASKLPDHNGEFFAIKAYYDLPRVDSHFIRRLLGNFGRTESERRRNAPILAEFIQSLPD